MQRAELLLLPWEESRRTSAHPWWVCATAITADGRSAGGDQPQLNRMPGHTLKMASFLDNCSSKMNYMRWGFAIQKTMALLRQAPAFPFSSSCPTRSLLV